MYSTSEDIDRRKLIQKYQKEFYNSDGSAKTKKSKVKINLTSDQIPDTDFGQLLHFKTRYPVSTFSQNNYQMIVGIISYIATRGRFDIQYYASALAQFCGMPTHRAYSQALQVLQYVYSTRTSVYTVLKVTPEIHELKYLTIKLFTDASYNTHISQGGYFMTVNGMFVGSKSYRLKYNLGCSFDAEMLALREGVTAAKTFRSSLIEIDLMM